MYKALVNTILLSEYFLSNAKRRFHGSVLPTFLTQWAVSNDRFLVGDYPLETDFQQ